MSGSILITGANGFLGSRCVERLAADSGRHVVATWHRGRDRLLGAPPRHIRYEHCDLSDRLAVDRLFTECRIESVLHAAAWIPSGQPESLREAVQANVVATANVIESAASRGCVRFVYCSSIGVYGAAPARAAGWSEQDASLPTSLYGWSKHAGEECLRVVTQSGAMWGASLRLAGIHGVGRHGGVLYAFASAALRAQPLSVTDSASRFQWLFVDDAVEAIVDLLAREPSKGYSCFNMASHLAPSLRTLADLVVSLAGSRSEIRIVPGSASPEAVMDTRRASHELQFAATPVSEALGAIIEALRT